MGKENLIKIVLEKVKQDISEDAYDVLSSDLSIKLASKDGTPLTNQIQILNIVIGMILFRYKYKYQDEKINNVMSMLVFDASPDGWYGLFESDILPYLVKHEVFTKLYGAETRKSTEVPVKG